MSKIENLRLISIVVDPIPYGNYLFSEIFRRSTRFILNKFFKNPFWYNPKFLRSSSKKYRGHFAVTRSLIYGFKANEIDFNYQPIFPWQIGDIFLVLAGIRSLKQAIDLKKKKLIKKLVAGPNNITFASESKFLISSQEIDLIIVPSDWVKKLYLEDCPSLKNKIFVWPAGVDCKFWHSRKCSIKNKILIFEKQAKGPVGPIKPYYDYLKLLGYSVDILKYGEFTQDEYLKKLQESSLMIGFSRDESQGIAWAEAWATDVPTLLWKNSSNYINDRKFLCSTAPYLNSKNGMFFDNFEDFKVKFQYWRSHKGQFSPRDWVLSNMSDEVCAKSLYSKIISL
jgi:hypothetical protein